MTFQQTEQMMRRMEAMEKYHVDASIWPTMDVAMTTAEVFLKSTSRVLLWPLKNERWMVIAQLPMAVN